ncbi:MAG: hypothetical protein PWP17_1166 [Desulfomicrobiaceae bacterium]|nr:hypothetical protein [Desulfomicrobiaceae bacterium]
MALYLPGHGQTAFFTGTVDFRHQGLEHRWAGWNFHGLHIGAETLGRRGHGLPDPGRDGVALFVAHAARGEVDLDFRLMAPFAAIVVTHQPIEGEGRGGTHVELDVRHRRVRQHCPGDGLGCGHGLFQGRAFGHVDDELQFALVVEGEHLHQHQAQRKHGHGQEEERRHGAEKDGPIPGMVDEPAHEIDVELGEAAAGVFGVLHLAAQKAFGEPWGDHEGHGHGEQHGDAGAHRHGPHVGAHEAAHEGHGHDGGDDGEGGEHQGAAHLRDRVHDDLREAFAPGLGQPEVADDVFHVHDGVVHQDADAEDEGKEGDTVESVAKEPIRGQGDGQGDGHGHHDHEARPQAQKQGHDGPDTQGRQRQMEEEFVGLVAGGCTVVPHHHDLYIRRQDASHQGAHEVLDLVADAGGALAGALGHGEGHGRGELSWGKADALGGLSRTCGEEDVVFRFQGAVAHLGHVFQVHGLSVVYGHHHTPDLACRGESAPQAYRLRYPGAVHIPGHLGLIVGLKLFGHLGEIKAEEPQLFRIGLHSDTAALTADDGDFTDAGDAAHCFRHFQGHVPQACGRAVRAGEA